jgi:hypothetical protein
MASSDLVDTIIHKSNDCVVHKVHKLAFLLLRQFTLFLSLVVFAVIVSGGQREAT